jgi:hypothetical protein
MPDIVAAALKIRRTQQDVERRAAGEIWRQTNDMPSLIFTVVTALQLIPPLSTGSSRRAARRWEFVRSLFMMPGTCATLLVDRRSSDVR